MLLSTTGFTLSEHVCQNELQEFHLFGGGCCSAMADSPCQHDGKQGCSEEGEDGKNCCDSHAQYFKSDTEKQTQTVELKQLKNPVLLSAIFVVFNIKLPSFETAQVNFLTYKPPIVCTDILILLQTFLC